MSTPSTRFFSRQELNLARLRKIQIASFVAAIIVGGLAGAILGRMLDHHAADGNVVSRLLGSPGTLDPSFTITVCAYAGILIAVMFALAFNRILHGFACRAVAKSVESELRELLRK